MGIYKKVDWCIVMKEYWLRENKLDFKVLKSPQMPLEVYKEAHKGLVLSCHDIFIEYKGGLILVNWEGSPTNGFFWPIGERLKRGFSVEDSLKLKVKEECNLNLSKITELGDARGYSNEEPFGHRKGTDAVSFVYPAKGSGKLKLNKLHTNALIVMPKDYKKFRKSLNDYVRDYMDLAFKHLKH